MKHIRKFILESKSTTETEFEVLQSLHKLGLVEDSELIVHKYIISGSTGDLELEGTPITELPAGLRVGGSLYLHGTSITELPAGLRVGGNLDLRDTPIAKKYSRAQLKKMFPGVKGTIVI
jgi:hypothetical protein